MNQVLLLLVIASATSIWLAQRWAMRQRARAMGLGLCATVVSLLLSAVVCALQRRSPFWLPATGFGATMGLFSSFLGPLVFLHCLRIGPAGPTVTMWNLGLVWPVAIGLVWFSRGAGMSLTVAIGVMSTVLALSLMAWNRPPQQDGRRLSAEWARWGMLAWVLSGLTYSVLLVAGHHSSQDGWQYVFGANIVGTSGLASVHLAKRAGRLRREEWLAGLFAGIVGSAATPIMLVLVARMPAAVLFPLVNATPVILMLLIGHFHFKEELNTAGWAAGLAGVVGIVLLSVAQHG